MLNHRSAEHKSYIYQNEVLTRFGLYNSLFLTLPFYKIKDTGSLLPFFFKSCEEGVRKSKTPGQIIAYFFRNYTPYTTSKDIIDLLFRFIQYIERQVVLFDAVEDAVFDKLNTMEDLDTLENALRNSGKDPEELAKIETLLNGFSLRIVLTAHPTQFYPGNVLAIITDLKDAIRINDLNGINGLLQQLGKTPFFNKKSPTPVDEALSLAWFLENVFYFAAANVQTDLSNVLLASGLNADKILELGFWPGGDRDGNPNVTTAATLAVAKMLRQILFRCYYRDFRNLKRRITFKGTEQPISALQDILYNNAFNPPENAADISAELTGLLNEVKATINAEHEGLFVEIVEDLLQKVALFGNYFASLDIRQDSRILRRAHSHLRTAIPLANYPENFGELPEEAMIAALTFPENDREIPQSDDALVTDTLDTIRAVKTIQHQNGEDACNRFIISNCQHASDMLQLMELFLLNGWTKNMLTVDFVPLFETVNDLKGAEAIMETLYAHPFYKQHLRNRGNKQDIMLGFSDSTKDGGYLMANWSIFNAKAALTAVSKKHNIQLAFFDGRGGPPARGGGKTHRFYASIGKEIANKNIQLTIQGQSISSQYGSVESAEFNIAQLIDAGITSGIENAHNILLNPMPQQLVSAMAEDSYRVFLALRNHPLFLKYLEKFTPLNLLSKINISSRPVKRNAGGELKLEDLRAISFVTAWGMLKQNIPGFFGMGTALKNQEKAGNWEQVLQVYKQSDYFRTIADNCMMSMSKTDFSITAHLAHDKEFGAFWQLLKNEFDLTKEMLLKLSGEEELMENYPLDKKSIAMREQIIMPLVLIQHYALNRMQHSPDEEDPQSLEKLTLRTVFGIVNAGRNLA